MRRTPAAARLDTAGRPVPAALFRWMTPGQAEAMLAADRLEPSWRHLVPETGRLEEGICLSDDPSKWKAQAHKVGVALRADAIPDGVRVSAFNAQMVWANTREYEAQRRAAAEASAPEVRAAHLALADGVAARNRAEQVRYAAHADEWFVLGPLDGVLRSVAAVAVVEDAVPALEGWLDRLRALGVDVSVVPGGAEDDEEALETAALDAFGHLLETGDEDEDDPAPAPGM